MNNRDNNENLGTNQTQQQSTNTNSGRLSNLVNQVDLTEFLDATNYLNTELNDIIQTTGLNNQSMLRNQFFNNVQRSQQETVGYTVNADSSVGSANQIVLNLGTEQNETDDNQQRSNEQQQQQQQNQQAPQNGIFNLIFLSMQTSLPFFIILIAKIFHQHLLGFFIVLAFMTTLQFSNRTLVNQIELKGNYYSTIEILALFYRCLTPIYPWILYLLYAESGAKLIDELEIDKNNSNTQIINNINNNNEKSSLSAFPVFLCIIYFIFKLNQIYTLFNDLVQSFRDMVSDSSYGVPVILTEHDENVCPICQDKYKNPVILKCKHSFCEDCVCVWLDKENSCPMCRARVSVKKPKYRDGSTSMFVQWF